MTLLHITAGLLSLLAGAVALFTAKGMDRHRRWGHAFVAAMWVMTASGALIAAQLKPNIGSLMVALLTFYLVTTAWLTVRYPVEQIRAILIGGMLAAFALAGFAFLLGTVALHSPDGRVDRLPPQPMFGFGVIGLLAGLLDARLLWVGSITGKHRIARHLWRMCMALLIATTSFFLGQAKQFPEPIRKSGLLTIPVLIVIGMLLYSLVRVMWPRRRRRDAPAM